jgi:hypothetical protein
VIENSPLQKSSDLRLSNLEVEEKAADAAEILNHPAFKSALNDIYSRAEGTLLEADIGSLTAGAAHATMKAITAIRKQLEEYINDHKMRQKYHRGSDNG